MIVYHGSSVAVPRPDTIHSYRALDFGPGFYVTSVEEQAINWAKRKAAYVGCEKGVLNRYQMANDFSGFRVLRFAPDLNDWLDFVCACRDEQPVYQQYDVIWGKVADDKVFRVVEKYHSGDWERERALKEIRAYSNYDQIAFITQSAIDGLLKYEGSQEV